MDNSCEKTAQIAARPENSKGRFITERESEGRTVFQRDRDRIIHCTAFRRLKHKTQVFVYHEGDHFRTRLTHSLEVAQVARSISRALGLDEDLTEALALAHDLGHTPFGHAGETALNTCMKEWGGFDHNGQALRIVTSLERRYAAFDGLNLTWETLEGLIKHNGPLTASVADFETFEYFSALQPHSFASAEAQVAAISDDIAYNAHDIDDGLRARLFDVIDLADVPLAGDGLSTVLAEHPKLERARLTHETVRRVISSMVRDLLAETRKIVGKSGVQNADEVRALGRPIVGFSPQMRENNRVLQKFLNSRMYQHEKVQRIMQRAQRVIHDLFNCYMEDPNAMPQDWFERVNSKGEAETARQICDFIAGMTDRYAIDEHKRLFDLEPLFR